MDLLQRHIEALIFCAQSPVKVVELEQCLSKMFDSAPLERDISAAIDCLDKKYRSEEFAFQLYKVAGGYQFMTKPAYQASIGLMLRQFSKKRLSTSALETLSIIAYKHPVSRVEIENIRGVKCDYALHRLLEKGLIHILGRANTVGRPLLYGVSPKFMEYFGLNDLSDLPTPKDFAREENTIGEEAEI